MPRHGRRRWRAGSLAWVPGTSFVCIFTSIFLAGAYAAAGFFAVLGRWLLFIIDVSLIADGEYIFSVYQAGRRNQCPCTSRGICSAAQAELRCSRVRISAAVSCRIGPSPCRLASQV